MPKINQPIAAIDLPTALRIERAPRGGFFVVRPASDYARIPEGPVFACTEIADALGFIKDELAPVTAGEPGPIVWTDGDKVNAAQIVPGIPPRCPHCGISEGQVVDDRCTRACMAVPGPEINEHGDIFK